MQNLRITYIERESKSTANEKAIEILGNTKEYIKALQHESPVPEIQYAETDPEHPIKDLQTQEEPDLSSGIQLDEKHQTEQFVTYYISSVLGARGYTVYNGAVYYKGNTYGGLIFTKGEVFIEEAGNTICSCGFVQLVDSDYSGIRITDRIVDSGLIAVSTETFGASPKAFIVDEYATFESFSGIFNDYYFRYQQSDHYVIEIDIQNNTKSNYDSSVELYNFDNNKSVYSPNSSSALEELYVKDNESFQGAASTVNAIAAINETSSDDLSTVVVLDGNTIDSLIGLAETGTNSVSKFIKAKLGNLKLVGNQFITISPEGNANILGAKTDEDETRITDGVLEAVGSGLAAAGTVASIIIVTHAGVATVSAIVITTGTSAVVYNLSNMLEGIQDIYYGSKGREDESAKIIHIYSLKYSLKITRRSQGLRHFD